MHLDLYVSIAGMIVGFVVGLTGMGGGALMTPILVLIFGVEPLTAVSSDLVAALVMKPVGGAVHFRRGNVNTTLVKWLMLGSVPAAFAGVLVLRMLGNSEVLQTNLKIVLGVALLVACGSMLAKGFVQRRREAGGLRDGERGRLKELRVMRLPTVLIGALGGLVVGMTSVGSGSLIIVMLLILYPRLTASSLVGTDLVQAVPLVASAALGHILFGDFALGLTASMLLGSIPGVYVGARLSARAPDVVVRKALVFVLLASGLKLVNVSTIGLAWIMGSVALVWFVLPFVLRRAGVPLDRFAERARVIRHRVLEGLVGALRGAGGVARAYVSAVRPKLLRTERTPD
ncbi:MAG TPA: sulfite exporter TauE/SafE family protein [Actinomycetota bacterium]